MRYVEIRWGPRLHVAGGLSLADGIAAVCAGARDGAARTGTVVRLISTALRSHDPEGNVELAETAARFIDKGLTGWDLAGPEAAFPDPLDHARAFEAARALGLRTTIHAGEWGGAAQVRRALVVEPERIAHGPGTIDDPELCAELRARGITLDLCPASNWQAGIVPSVAAHPLARLHRAGVPVTLSTDDTTVSDITLSEEYVAAVEEIGLTLPELWAIDRRALDVAFADEAALGPLRAGFDAWAAGIPELADSASGQSRAVRANRGESPPAIAASSRASAATAIGRSSVGEGLDLGASVTPVSIITQRAPTARAAAKSVPRPSPIMIASRASRPTASAASSSRCGAGLPMDSGVTPVVASRAAAIVPAPGRRPRSVG